MDEVMREYIFEQVREVEREMAIQNAATRQLNLELQAEVHRGRKNGTAHSLLYQMLPPEIRHQIYAHVVAADQSVHVFPPKGNEKHGYRLSLCDESTYDFQLGHCNCEDGRHGRVQSSFFNTAIFLVSQSVRREALDAFFITNSFTFTCLYELTRFTTKFRQSSSKIQKLRLFERADDYPHSEFRIQGIQKARQRLTGLKHLDLHLFVSDWTHYYEKLYEDGLVLQLLHFALGAQPERKASQKRTFAEFSETEDETVAERSENKASTTRDCPTGKVRPPFLVPALRSFTPHVRVRTSFLATPFGQTPDPKAEYYAALSKRLSLHLSDVFMDAGRRYITVGDVPALMPKPPVRVRDEEKQLRGVEKRGLLFMED